MHVYFLSLFASKGVLELTTLMEFLADVDTADELPVHVDLRVGRPVWELLQAFSYLFILVYIEVTVFTYDICVLIE